MAFLSQHRETPEGQQRLASLVVATDTAATVDDPAEFDDLLDAIGRHLIDGCLLTGQKSSVLKIATALSICSRLMYPGSIDTTLAVAMSDRRLLKLRSAGSPLVTVCCMKANKRIPRLWSRDRSRGQLSDSRWRLIGSSLRSVDVESAFVEHLRPSSSVSVVYHPLMGV